MKKSVMLVLCILLGMLFVVSMASAYTGGTGIKQTAHDLSVGGGNGAAVVGDNAEQGGLDRICIYCHAPHNTIKPGSAEADGVNYLPLWNHDMTTATYKMYSNGTELPNDVSHQSQAMVALTGKTRPGGVSRLCLSCHDGSVATNAYGQYNSSSTGAANKFVSTAGLQYEIGSVVGTIGDLTNHHPIGFAYDAATADDDEIAAKTTVMVTTTGVTIGDLLWNGNMECTTCHDVHNTKNTGEKFLWTTDEQSAFCLTCHLKSETPK
jgi:predicted CXXCH cytochrome family protein